MLCTAWDDKSPHMENYWPGFIAAAEYSWSPQKKSLEKLDEVWSYKEFGIPIPQWRSLQASLRAGSELWYEALFEKGSWMDDDNMLQSLKQVEHWLKPMEGGGKKCILITARKSSHYLIHRNPANGRASTIQN